MFVRSSCLASFALLALACSGDDSSSTSSGAGSSSGGGSDGTCKFSGALSGGVEGSITPNGCATSGATFSVAQADLAKKTTLGMRFTLATALKGGELGNQPLAKLDVFQREGEDAPELVWSSTACTIELTKNEKSPTTVFENRFILEGTGACPSPLEPVAPNDRSPITATSFSFGAFINPR